MKTSTYRAALPGAGKPFECPTCGRRLVDKRSLRQHAAAAHLSVAVETTSSGATVREPRS